MAIFRQGYVPASAYGYIAGLVVVAFVGSWLGKRLLNRVPQELFRRGVLVLLLLIGLVTVGAALGRG